MLSCSCPDRTWRNDMAHFPKPAEGSWTRALPRARHRTGVLRGLDLTRALRARAQGHLRPHLAERGPGGAASPQRAATSPRSSTPPARRWSSSGARTARSASSTTSAGTAATSWCGPTTPARRPAGPAASSPASTTAGATPSRAQLTFVQQESEFFDLDKDDYGLVPRAGARRGRGSSSSTSIPRTPRRCASTSGSSGPASPAIRSTR